MKKLLLIGLLLQVYSTSAMAGTADGFIRWLSVRYNDVAIIWPEGSWGAAGTNDCSTVSAIAIDISTDNGRAMLSLALAAKMSGNEVRMVTYQSDCLAVGGWASKVSQVIIK